MRSYLCVGSVKSVDVGDFYSFEGGREAYIGISLLHIPTLISAYEDIRHLLHRLCFRQAYLQRCKRPVQVRSSVDDSTELARSHQRYVDIMQWKISMHLFVGKLLP